MNKTTSFHPALILVLWAKFLPVRLFRPLRLFIFCQNSTLYTYSGSTLIWETRVGLPCLVDTIFLQFLYRFNLSWKMNNKSEEVKHGMVERENARYHESYEKLHYFWKISHWKKYWKTGVPTERERTIDLWIWTSACCQVRHQDITGWGHENFALL